jgi:hypothetical protein
MATEGIDDALFTDIAMPDAEAPAAPASDTDAPAADPADPNPNPDAAPGDDTQPAGEGDDTLPAGDGDDPLRDGKGRFKGGFQARIDELTEARRSAERRAALAEAKVAALNSSDEGAPQAKPDPADYTDYGEYIRDLTRYEVKAAAAESAGKDATEATGDVDRIRADTWATKVQASKSTLTDFDDVVGKSEIPIAGHVALALMEADKGPELAYHLAQNPDVADRLNGMSEARAAIELGKIETTLGVKAPKAASKAPAPIEPVRSGSSQAKPLDKIDDMEEYKAARRKQGARY